jgi:hypothetical protein
MTEKRVAERVKGQLYRKAADSVAAVPVTLTAEPPPQDALEVLTLAQQTAEKHLAAVTEQACELQDAAQARAEQVHREAHAYADRIRAEADKVLVDARAATALSNREAEAQAADIRRQAERALAEARAEAERIVATGREHADQLKVRAHQRYEDAVGGLAVERAALQKQIEALSAFDTEYRQQLTAFMQSQLRTLWAGQSETGEEPIDDVAPN